MPVVPFPLKMDDERLLSLIRKTAADTSRVFITLHATARMKERKITLTQIYSCLRHGNVSEPAHLNSHGNWQCTLNRRYAGDDVTVVAAVKRDSDGNSVIVVTVFH